jgi:hypothetical protein
MAGMTEVARIWEKWLSRREFMSRADLPAVEKALEQWLKSQELAPFDAAFAMVHLAGIITGSVLDKDDINKFLGIFIEVMRDGANNAFKAKMP